MDPSVAPRAVSPKGREGTLRLRRFSALSWSALSTAAILLLAAGPEPVAAGPLPQGVRSESGPVAAAVARGDELHRRQRPRRALKAYETALEHDPAHHAALWKAAREATILGTLAAERSAREEWYEKALEYARRAVERAPDDPEGHIRTAIAACRLARTSPTLPALELLDVARTRARRAVELAGGRGDAHHAAGLWNAEGARLGRLARFAARMLPGGSAAADASWDAAERHLRRAVELEPDAIAHHLELARVYVATDRTDEARAALRRVLELPSATAEDPRHKEVAQRLLREMR